MENPIYMFDRPKHSDYIFRVLTELDLPSILAIEKTAYAFPWSAEIFKDCLRVGYQCKVIEQQGIIEGYGVMTLGASEAHILNLCIRKKSRRQGLANQLMAYFLDIAQRARVETMLLEVRPSNTAAIELYTNIGFNEIGLRKGYYPAAMGAREDALILARAL